MIFIPHHLWARLIANGQAKDGTDHVPVVKFFDPCGAATWLITEVAQDHDTLFGLCDLGLGFPELGTVSLAELKSAMNRLGLPLERDLYFASTFPLSVYLKAAQRAERITEDDIDLAEAAKALGQEAFPDANSPTT